MAPSDSDLSTFDPDDLPPSVDEAAIRRMRIVAKVMDDLVRVPGTDYRFGLDPVIGVVPGIGDAVGAAISTYIVLEAARLGVSWGTLLRMIANVAIDAGSGLLPYVGGLFDTAWKTNVRNVELVLEDLLEHEGLVASDPVTIEIESA